MRPGPLLATGQPGRLGDLAVLGGIAAMALVVIVLARTQRQPGRLERLRSAAARLLEPRPTRGRRR